MQLCAVNSAACSTPNYKAFVLSLGLGLYQVLLRRNRTTMQNTLHRHNADTVAIAYLGVMIF